MGHANVACMEYVKNSNNIREELFERHRHTWVHNIKVVLEKYSVRVWTELKRFGIMSLHCRAR
jgi:hypothetical protein